MESSSQASEPPERTSHKLANFIGTLIALLTLAVPLVAIAHFSSIDTQPWRTPAQLLPRSRD